MTSFGFVGSFHIVVWPIKAEKSAI